MTRNVMSHSMLLNFRFYKVKAELLRHSKDIVDHQLNDAGVALCWYVSGLNRDPENTQHKYIAGRCITKTHLFKYIVNFSSKN